MAIKISFFNSKGGAGKTAFTTVIATLIHNTTKAKVCIIDGDPQFDLIDNHLASIAELKETKNTEGIKLPPLEVIKVEMPENKSEVDYMKKIHEEIKINAKKYDILFLNLRGTKHTKGIGRVLASINHFFIPIDADKTSLKTGFELYNIFEKMINSNETDIKTAHIFKNRVSNTKFVDEWRKFDKVMEKLEVSTMKSYMKDLVEFSRSSYSTIYPINLRVNLSKIEQKGRIYPFYLEILNIIKRK